MPPCCLKLICRKQCGGFFVSGPLRPHHNTKFLKLKEDIYGIFCKRD